ncbi:MAG: hypothetical protein EOO41_00920 [Methanobacteriota archaeon]|nr:MAG: hypothetical protein EOO41_00920 [Euryarchaeota archaeon]
MWSGPRPPPYPGPRPANPSATWRRRAREYAAAMLVLFKPWDEDGSPGPLTWRAFTAFMADLRAHPTPVNVTTCALIRGLTWGLRVRQAAVRAQGQFRGRAVDRWGVPGVETPPLPVHPPGSAAHEAAEVVRSLSGTPAVTPNDILRMLSQEDTYEAQAGAYRFLMDRFFPDTAAPRAPAPAPTDAGAGAEPAAAEAASGGRAAPLPPVAVFTASEVGAMCAALADDAPPPLPDAAAVPRAEPGGEEAMDVSQPVSPPPPLPPHNDMDAPQLPVPPLVCEADVERLCPALATLNREQRAIADELLRYVLAWRAAPDRLFAPPPNAPLLLVHGGPGTGKTHLMRTVDEAVRALGAPGILSCAFTGVAASLLSRGRTIHNVFHLSVGGQRRGAAESEVTFADHARDLFAYPILLVDEVSMLSSSLLQDIGERLQRYAAASVRASRPWAGMAVVLLQGDARSSYSHPRPPSLSSLPCCTTLACFPVGNCALPLMRR